MAVVVVLVVQTVEGSLFPIVQGTVDIVVLHTDTRVVFVRVIAVGHKQHVADKRIQAVAYPDAVLIRFAGKVGLYLALGIEFGTHPVNFPRICRFDERLLYVIGMRAEHLSEEILVYVRFQELIAERETVTLYLLTRHGQGGHELTQQTVHGVHRNFPDSEETEDMVNAVGIEVFRHFAETLHPPRIAVLFHDIPVVGGETPVLSVYGEIIGRCAGLSVQVEIVGFCPCFYAVAADADGDVTFQHNTIGTCMFGSGKQLQMQVELDIKVNGYMRVIG